MIMKAGKSSKPVVKKKSGFVYKKRDPKTVRARAEQTGGKYDSIFKSGFDTYTAKMGDNCIRFLPPTWEDHEHYGLDIWVHSYVGVNSGSYLCLQKMKNKHCPICEAAAASKEAGETDEAKKLEANRRVLTWVLDRDGDTKTPQLYSLSWSMDKDISTLADNKRSGEVLLIDHPDEGYDVSFKRTGQKLNTRYVGVAIDRSPSSLSDRQKDQDAITAFIEENPLPSVLQYKSADFLEKIIDGTQEEKDEELDEETGEEEGEEEEETSSKKSKVKPKVKPKARRPAPDEEEEADPDEEEEDPPFDPDEEEASDEEEEEERPAKVKPKVKPKARRPDPEEEEETEEEAEPEEEEEERPAKSSVKRKPVRKEPEDEEEETEDDGEEAEEETEEESEEDGDGDDTEEEEEEETPKRRVVRPVTKKGRR